MFTEEKKAAEFALQEDERVLWAERRKPRWDAKKTCVAGLMLALVACVAFVLPADVLHCCVLLFMVMALAGIMCNMWLREAHSVYLLTDKRALIVEEAMWGCKAAVISVPLHRKLIAMCKRRANGRADYFFLKYTEGLNRSKDGFLNVQAVLQLETQLAALGLSLPAQDESRPLTQLPRPTPLESLCYDVSVSGYLYDYVKREFPERDLHWWVYLLVGACALKLLQMIWRDSRCFLLMRRQNFYVFAPETEEQSGHEPSSEDRK